MGKNRKLMSTLHFSLFGKLKIQNGQTSLTSIESRKARELLCYLLLHRRQIHHRETLSVSLWENDLSTHQSKKQLRQALWYVQSFLQAHQDDGAPSVLLVEPDWVRVNPQAEYWADIAEFEQAFEQIQAVPGSELTEPQVTILEHAVNLYQGDLLEGWYREWCIYERERLQAIYLSMLDKLLEHCIEKRLFEAGQTYGTKILRYDLARERTHRRLMRLYHQTGHRTAALRQYESWVVALTQELGVEPAPSTVQLYEEIRSAREPTVQPLKAADVVAAQSAEPTDQVLALGEALHRLQELQDVVSSIKAEIQECIKSVEQTLQDLSQ
jgi:DNA-binding SARP family transcriptional activator